MLRRASLNSPASVGQLLSVWRRQRHLSQLDLALTAGVSAKHLSFIETGRATPSRTMIVELCDVLDVPLPVRNDMLLAAGFAPVYRKTPLSDRVMRDAFRALTLVLDRADPFGAVAYDGGWNIVMANRAYVAMAARYWDRPISPLTLVNEPRPNLLDAIFRPDGYRHCVRNWQQVARAVYARVSREIAENPDPERLAVLDRISAEVPPAQSGFGAKLPQQLDVMLPVELVLNNAVVRLFNTITNLGAANDITLRDIRIETLYPADDRALAQVRRWAETAFENNVLSGTIDLGSDRYHERMGIS